MVAAIYCFAANTGHSPGSPEKSIEAWREQLLLFEVQLSDGGGLREHFSRASEAKSVFHCVFVLQEGKEYSREG